MAIEVYGYLWWSSGVAVKRHFMAKNCLSKKLKYSKMRRKLSEWKLSEKMILGANYEQDEEGKWNWRQPAWKAGTHEITACFL